MQGFNKPVPMYNKQYYIVSKFWCSTFNHPYPLSLTPSGRKPCHSVKGGTKSIRFLKRAILRLQAQDTDK